MEEPGSIVETELRSVCLVSRAAVCNSTGPKTGPATNGGRGEKGQPGHVHHVWVKVDPGPIVGSHTKHGIVGCHQRASKLKYVQSCG